MQCVHCGKNPKNADEKKSIKYDLYECTYFLGRKQIEEKVYHRRDERGPQEDGRAYDDYDQGISGWSYSSAKLARQNAYLQACEMVENLIVARDALA